MDCIICCVTESEATEQLSLSLFRMVARLCSKSFKLGFSSSWTKNFQMHMLGFREAKEPSNCQRLLDHRKSNRIPEKKSTSASLTILKPLTVWITTNCGKFLKRWEYETTLPVSWEAGMQIKKQQDLKWNNRLVQNWERNIIRLHISPCLFNF